MVVLDTSFLIDLIQKDVLAFEKLKDLENDNEMICTTIINALELFRGVFRSSQIERNHNQVNEILTGLIQLNIDSGVLEIFGQLSSGLLTEGCRIGDFDEIIAAICITHNQSILTRDSHFDKVPGLSVMKY